MRPNRSTRARGQILPMMAALLSVFAIVTLFIFNVAIFNTTGQVAMDGALRNAALAALQQVDTTQGYARWYVDPTAATATARSYATTNLSGGTGAANYRNLFAGNLATILSNAAGTSGNTVDGLDVEIIDPAARSGQTSARFMNGSVAAVTVCNSGSYPEQVQSAVNGTCYDTGVVILRLRLSVTQATGPAAAATRVIVVKAGTNA